MTYTKLAPSSNKRDRLAVGTALAVGVAVGVSGVVMGAVGGGVVVVVVGVVVGVVTAVVPFIVDGWSRGGGFVRGVDGSLMLRAAAGLLPTWAAGRYHEEWRGELYDLRAEGTPWWRRVEYILGILLRSVPRLAVTLRLGRERLHA